MPTAVPSEELAKPLPLPTKKKNVDFLLCQSLHLFSRRCRNPTIILLLFVFIYNLYIMVHFNCYFNSQTFSFVFKPLLHPSFYFLLCNSFKIHGETYYVTTDAMYHSQYLYKYINKAYES